MKIIGVVDQIERLEEQLQAVKWTVRPFHFSGHGRPRTYASIVARTAGLWRGRLANGRTYQRQLRQEWERRFAREVR